MSNAWGPHATRLLIFSKGIPRKKPCADIIALLFAGVAFLAAKPVLGKKVELGTSISYDNLKFDADEGRSLSYLNVPGGDSDDWANFLQGKLPYNFGLAGKLVPSTGGGPGIGPGLLFSGVIEGGADLKTFVYTGLLGFKFIIGNAAAIRIEYGFNRFGWENPHFK